jgi:hypothetical protein
MHRLPCDIGIGVHSLSALVINIRVAVRLLNPAEWP